VNKNLKGNIFKQQPLQVSEAAISRSIKQYLDARNIFNIRINSGMVRVLNFRNDVSWMQLAPKGTPDRLALYKSWSVWIEVKRTGGRVSPEQRDMHKRIREAGGFVIIAESIDDVIEGLKEIDEI